MKKKELIQQLQSQNQELQALEKFKSSIMPDISHELKTPLNSIIGFSSLLLKNKTENLNEKQLKYLSSIHNNGLKLLNMIIDAIELSRLGQNKTSLTLEEINLTQFIEKLISVLQPKANEKSIKLEFTSNIDSNHSIHLSDKEKLKSILLYLVTNSLEFTPRTTGVIKVQLDENKDHFLITIADNRDTKELLDTQENLELTIANEIISYLNGFIKIKSKETYNNIFNVYLKKDKG